MQDRAIDMCMARGVCRICLCLREYGSFVMGYLLWRSNGRGVLFLLPLGMIRHGMARCMT